MIFGLILIALAIGAATSDEPAAQTDNGKMGILFAAILGILLIASNAVAISKDVNARKNPLPPPPPAAPVMVQTQTVTSTETMCPSCGKGISTEFVACPFCGTSIKHKCPNCGKMLSSEYVACPYCGIRVGSSVADAS
ncbi:MAG TPA: zinc ribbon domain-containing protein [Thermoplasmata archaeon]|nr:zinc ribbon domain-containing protein [Thermoplasmata archaeon]